MRPGMGERGLALEEKCESEAVGKFQSAGKARVNRECVVCGPENPCGLHLEFAAEDGVATAHWTATAGWESFKGTIHGGVTCAVLDEAMSRAIVSAGYTALTAEIRVRFREKVIPGEELKVRGWVVGVRKRRIEAESSLVGANGVEKARGWGTFLMARGE